MNYITACSLSPLPEYAPPTLVPSEHHFWKQLRGVVGELGGKTEPPPSKLGLVSGGFFPAVPSVTRPPTWHQHTLMTLPPPPSRTNCGSKLQKETQEEPKEGAWWLYWLYWLLWAYILQDSACLFRLGNCFFLKFLLCTIVSETTWLGSYSWRLFSRRRSHSTYVLTLTPTLTFLSVLSG